MTKNYQARLRKEFGEEAFKIENVMTLLRLDRKNARQIMARFCSKGDAQKDKANDSYAFQRNGKDNGKSSKVITVVNPIAITKEMLDFYYTQEQCSIAEVAHLADTTYGIIKGALTKHKIKCRPRKKQVQLLRPGNRPRTYVAAWNPGAKVGAKSTSAPKKKATPKKKKKKEKKDTAPSDVQLLKMFQAVIGEKKFAKWSHKILADAVREAYMGLVE